jgi:prepilin peptidase CpaA
MSTLRLVGLVGMGTGFVVLLPFYLLRAMGAGDVKLMAMVGAFLGPWPAFLAILSTGVAGGVIALGFLLWTGNLRRGFNNVISLMRQNLLTAPIGYVDLNVSPTVSAGKLPYGVAIAAGTIVFLVSRQLGFIH